MKDFRWGRSVGCGTGDHLSGRAATIIRVGTASWTDPGFIADWYPPRLPAAERQGWYAHHFNLVELNLRLIAATRGAYLSGRTVEERFRYQYSDHELLFGPRPARGGKVSGEGSSDISGHAYPGPGTQLLPTPLDRVENPLASHRQRLRRTRPRAHSEVVGNAGFPTGQPPHSSSRHPAKQAIRRVLRTAGCGLDGSASCSDLFRGFCPLTHPGSLPILGPPDGPAARAIKPGQRLLRPREEVN